MNQQSNLSAPFMGDYVRRLQQQINAIQTNFNTIFSADGVQSAQGDIHMNNHNITDASSITVGVLNYGALNPPVSSGGNISGPLSSTDNALVRYDGTTGQIVKNSGATLSDTGVLTVNTNTIDMATTGTINFGATNLLSSGVRIVTSTASSAVDGEIAILDGTTGHVIRSSGILATTIATKLPLSGGTVTGSINMTGNSITNIGTVTGGTNSSVVDDLVSSSAGPVTDNNIAIFDGTSGRLIKDSGVLATSIALKVNRAGDTMTGNLSLGGNNLSSVANIAGAIKTSAVDSLVTSSASSVVDSDIAVFDSTTGKIIKSSAIAVSSIAGKLSLSGGTMSGAIAMGTNNITNIGSISGAVKTSAVDSLVTSSSSSVVDEDLVCFDSTTGKIVKTSGIAAATITSKVSKSGDTMSGSLNMGGNNISNVGMFAGSIKTMNPNAIVTTSSGSATDSNIVVFDLTSGNVVKDSGIQVSSIADKLPLSGGTMSGAIAMGTNNITNIGSISGATKTSVVDSIVTSSASSTTDGDIVVFDSTTGKIVKASSVAVTTIAGKLSLSGGTMAGAIAMGTNNITNVGIISGATNSRSADNIVSNSGAGVSGNVPVFSGASGKLIVDSGSSLSQYLPLSGGTMSGAIAMGANNITNVGTLSGATNSRSADDIVSNTGASVNARVAVFSGTTGKVITDGGTTLSQYALLSGATFSGAIAMGTNNITGIGSISGAVKTSAVDSIVTSSAGSAVDSDIVVFDSTTGKIVKSSAVGVATIATKLSLSGGTMSGAIAMGTNNITNVGTLSGATNSRSADDIVSNTGASVNARVAVFSGTSGKVITDGGTTLSQYALLSGATFSGAIAMGGNNITGANIVYLKDTQPASAGRYVMYTAVTLINSIAETSMLSGSSVGSLAYAPTQALGMVVKFRASFIASCNAGVGLWIRLKLNGGQVVLHQPTFGGGLSADVITQDVVATIRSDTQMSITSKYIHNGEAPAINTQVISYDRTATNTWSYTCQWGAASTSNSITLNSFHIETVFNT